MGAPKTSDNQKDEEKSTVSGSDDGVNKAFNADAIFTHLGFGWYQWKFIFWVGYGLLFPQAAILMYTFVGFVPRYRFDSHFDILF